jgi:integrase
MAIIKRPDSKGNIRYQVRLKGHPAATFDTRREALDHQASLRLKRKPKLAMTVNELVDRYNALWEEGQLPRQSGRPKQSTLSTRRQHLALFVDEFGSLDVNELDPLHVEAWATKNRWAVTSVNPIFNYAVKRDIVAHNRFAQYMPQPAEGRRHIAVLSDDELLRLAECAQSVWPYGKAFVLWQAYTGMRPSETYALDRPLEIADDVLKLEHGIYEGVMDTPKTGPRDVLLLPQALTALGQVPGIHGPLFQTVWGRRCSNNNMSATYWKQTRRAFAPCPSCGGEDSECNACEGRGYADGAPDIYDLRHWCAHLLYVRMDLPSRDVAAQLGNSPYLIENLYSHWKQGSADRLRDAVKERGVPFTTTETSTLREVESA